MIAYDESNGWAAQTSAGSEELTYDDPFHIDSTSKFRLMTRRQGSEDLPAHLAGLSESEQEFFLARKKARSSTIAKPFPQR
ncbi:MAG: hypothetical protein V1866_04680 [archaeon]